MTASPRPPARQPWPLWPIVVAIVVSIAGYTYLRLAHAKPAKPHEPYADHLRRTESEKFTAAGWVRAEAAFETVVEQPAANAPINTTAVGPDAVEELRRLSTETWHLPIEYSFVSAPAKLEVGAECTVHVQAELDQARAHIVAFDLFRKGTELVVLPRWEPYPAELTPRRPRTSGRLTIPAAALVPGRYRVTLPALKQSSQWLLEVPPTPRP